MTEKILEMEIFCLFVNQTTRKIKIMCIWCFKNDIAAS